MDNTSTTGIKLIYDLAYLPDGINVDQLYNIMINGGIIVFDSSKNPNAKPPQIVTEDLKLTDVAFWPKEDFEERFGELIKDKTEKDPFFSHEGTD